MKIGLIAHDYNPGTAGGIETYFLDLVESLQKIDQENMYIVFLNSNGRKKVEIFNKNFSICELNNSKPIRGLNKISPRLASKLGPAGQVNRFNFDVVHFPFQVINLPGVQAKKVISIMDIQQEYWPQFFSKEDLRAREMAFRPSIDVADAVISISDFTKQTIVEKYNTNPKKIKTVHLAYNEKNFNSQGSSNSLNLPKKYFYFPAASWPHKNHSTLIEAFSTFAKSYDFSLVLSGIKKQEHNKLAERVEELGLGDRVIMLGYLQYSDLPEVYRRAYALVFPSLFEGFGIPVLEAMACGCPVLCSNTTSLPEVAGNAALYFNPLEPESIMNAMVKIATSKSTRSQLILRGFDRVKHFSNTKMAQETIDVYKEVANK